MNEKKIIRLYNNGYTLRHISELLKSNHHRIKRILVKNGVKITRRKTKKQFTEEHKMKISISCKGRKVWSKGLTMSRNHILKNMKVHLKYNVTLEWLNSFEDIEKLKYLNRSLSRKRDCEGFNTKIYISFIEKFYNDKKFNFLFDKWIETKDRWIKPSLDHIISKSKGGKLNVLKNLQFISWLENRAKVDIEQAEWNKIKQRIYEYF